MVKLRQLRSAEPQKRPIPTSLEDGQLALNSNTTEPGLFFKDSNDELIKVGPVFIGSLAPNSNPAVGGLSGNSVGEFWYDTSEESLKLWNGSVWIEITGNIGPGTSGNGVIISNTAPTLRLNGNPLEDGDLWFDCDTGLFYIYFVDVDSSQWVEITGDGGNSSNGSVVITSDTAPTVREDNSNLQDGDLWFDCNEGGFYVYYSDIDSSQWIEVGGVLSKENNLEIFNQNTSLTTTPTGINFTGTGVTASVLNDEVTVNIPGSSFNLDIQDEGSSITSTPTSLNFTGDFTLSNIGNNVTIDVQASAGGSGSTIFTGTTDPGSVTPNAVGDLYYEIVQEVAGPIDGADLETKVTFTNKYIAIGTAVGDWDPIDAGRIAVEVLVDNNFEQGNFSDGDSTSLGISPLSSNLAQSLYVLDNTAYGAFINFVLHNINGAWYQG